MIHLSVMRLRMWGRWREGFLKVLPDSRSVQSSDPFTQLGLMMLHHMKYALHVGMDWVAWACWLDKTKKGTHTIINDYRITLSSLHEMTVLTVPVMKGIFWFIGLIGERVSNSDFETKTGVVTIMPNTDLLRIWHKLPLGSFSLSSLALFLP